MGGSMFLTAAEACQALRVSRPTLSKMIESGQVPVVRFGARSIRIPQEELLRRLGQTTAADPRPTA